MIPILYVDSGTTGGGSSESLYQHLCVLDRSRYRPIYVLLNRTKYVDKLAKLGVPVHVLTDRRFSLHSGARTRAWLDRAGRRISSHAPRLYPAFVRRAHARTIRGLVDLIRRERVRLVHTNVSISRDLFAVMAARRARVPVVCHLRGLLPPGTMAWSTRFNRDVSAYIAYSADWKRMWSELGVDAAKVHVIYNAVPPLRVRPQDLRKAFPQLRAAGAILGYVGRLEEWKIDDYLFAAFQAFRGRRPDAALLIVGDGTKRKALEDEVRRRSLSEHVVFAGARDDAKDLIAGLDALVVPSRLDCLGRVLLEAMAQGVPAVVTDVGGIRELLTDGSNAVIVPYGDADSFARKTERVLSDRSFRQAVTKNARALVEEKLTTNAYARQVAALYEHVIAGAQGPRVALAPGQPDRGGIPALPSER